MALSRVCLHLPARQRESSPHGVSLQLDMKLPAWLSSSGGSHDAANLVALWMLQLDSV